MTVLITLTAAGTDTGPFDLYSNLDGYTIPFEIGISKAALLGGYTSILVPDYTITIKVKSEGACINFAELPLVYPTTTTTTTIVSTTTTTTTVAPTTTTTTTVAAFAYALSSPGRASSGLACAEVSFPLTWYAADSVLSLTTQMYTSPSLDTPVGSGNLWYKEGIDGISYRIDNSGIIAEIISC